MVRSAIVTALLFSAFAGVGAAPAQAQVLDRLKRAARNAVEDETERQVERLLRNAVRCVFDDMTCIENARASGEEVVLTDDEGEVLMDDDGQPVTDPAAVMATPVTPGSGAWANYDFVPGDKVLFDEDYAADEVGDFPRRLTLVQGSWEIVEWQGGRYLRATSGGMVGVPLPETLPEKFTVEIPVNLQHGNAYVRVMPGRAYYGRPRDYAGSVASVEWTRAGVRSLGGGPDALRQLGSDEVRTGMPVFRIMADGEHMKVYLAEQRMANVPNAVLPRADTLFIAVSSATENSPIMLGAIRIAGGGRDLYDRLAEEGRVATRGILFATGSARIRPESTPTLEEIGSMLTEHPDLRLAIEGHTDDVGDDAFNQTLSEQRAAAVKEYLVGTYGVSGDRLETAGYGESRPAVPNDSSEGRQQNRRVELVRLGG